MRAGDATKKLVHVTDAQRGLHDLVCPDCGARVVANQGEVRRPYYSHHRRDECAHSGETAIHLLAKALIRPRQDRLYLPPATFDLDGRSITFQGEAWEHFDRIEIEKWEDGLRPDLIGIRDRMRDRVSDPVRLIIEIRVTHAVDREKSAELRRRKESAIEIDLSRFDRNLTEEELKRAILVDAPRQWLHHRGADAARRRRAEAQAREDAQKERRREMARQREADREEERRRARIIPHRGAGPRDVAWAEAQMLRWEALGLGSLIRGEAATDDIFDVEPEVWRAGAFDWAAPWGDTDLPGKGRQDIPEVAQAVARQLKEKGWVKKAYCQPKREWNGRYVVERDFVMETLQQFFDRITGRRGLRSEIDRMGAFRRHARDTWGEVMKRIRSLHGLQGVADEAGFNLWLEGSAISPGPEDIEAFVLHSMAQGRSFHAHTVQDVAYEIAHGHPQRGGRTDLEAICRHGIALLPWPPQGRRETSLSPEERIELTCKAVTDAADRKRASFEEALEVDARYAAAEHLSVFRGIVGDGDGLREVLSGDVRARYASEEAIMECIRVPIAMDAARPLETARREMEKRVEKVAAEIEAFKGLGDLAAEARDPGLERLIFREGCRLLARTGRGSRPAFRLDDPDTCCGARKLVEEISARADREALGAAFVRDALLWHPPEARISVLDALLTGDLVSARKAIARIRSDRRAHVWLRETRPSVDPLEGFQ